MKYTGRRQSDFFGQGQPTSPAAVSSSSNFASATISPSVSAAFTFGGSAAPASQTIIALTDILAKLGYIWDKVDDRSCEATTRPSATHPSFAKK